MERPGQIASLPLRGPLARLAFAVRTVKRRRPAIHHANATPLVKLFREHSARNLVVVDRLIQRTT
ncbi:MAG: hypothetical protein U0744_11425 [Gemmataceae bacterium]